MTITDLPTYFQGEGYIGDYDIRDFGPIFSNEEFKLFDSFDYEDTSGYGLSDVFEEGYESFDEYGEDSNYIGGILDYGY
jgi:hypothetical protein